MHRVEQQRIDRHDPRFATIDAAAFASKNRSTAALDATRQAFIHQRRAPAARTSGAHQRRVITYDELARDLKASVEFRALPATAAGHGGAVGVAAGAPCLETLGRRGRRGRRVGGRSFPLPGPSQTAQVPRQARAQSAHLHRAGDQPRADEARVGRPLGRGHPHRDPTDGHRPPAYRAAGFPRPHAGAL